MGRSRIVVRGRERVAMGTMMMAEQRAERATLVGCGYARAVQRKGVEWATEQDDVKWAMCRGRRKGG